MTRRQPVRLTSVELVFFASFKTPRLVAMMTVAQTRNAAKRRHPATSTSVLLGSCGPL